MRAGEHAAFRLEDLRDVEPLWPTIGRFLHLGRNAAYDAARRGEIPTLRFGKRLLVSKAALARLLAGDAHPTAGVSEPVSLRRVAP